MKFIAAIVAFTHKPRHLSAVITEFNRALVCVVKRDWIAGKGGSGARRKTPLSQGALFSRRRV